MSTQTTNTELQNLRNQVISAGVSSLTPVHAHPRGARSCATSRGGSTSTSPAASAS